MGLSEAEKKEMEKFIGKAVDTAIQTALGPYRVDKEQHYQDHQFLKKFSGFLENTGKTFWGTIVKGFAYMFFIFLILGFVVWTGISKV